MLVNNQSRFIFFSLLGLWLAVASCKNNEEPTPVLSITSFAPSAAPVGAEVTITGTEFDATPSNNTVQFNGVPAEVKSAAPSQLVVVVPAGATNGPISVSTGGVTVQSSGSFSLSNRPVTEVQGEITSNTRWTSDNIYLLKGFVYVTSGATLTIDPGTIIKGATPDQDPTGQSQGGSLIIEAGARIEAAGTVTEPIVFTSSKPAGQRSYGDWGGVVLIGKAPHNRPASFGPEGGIRGTLGTHADAADNSGTLKYVRIEFPGIALSSTSNSEINGLTLYGVGSGTTIEHVQVSYSGDDSFEWFGGTVNAKYLVALRGFDDDWDADWGFTGKVQYALSLRDPEYADQSGSNGFESDNFSPGEPATGPNDGFPLTEPVFANVSNFVVGSGVPSSVTKEGSGPYQSAMHLRRNTAISIYNSLFVGYPEGLRLDGTPTGTWKNAEDGRLDLRGIVLANMTTPVRGAAEITNEQAVAFFNDASRKNEILADISSLLLNSANFNLTTPGFLPQAASPLLNNAVWEGKAADAFFTKESFRGAFGTTDWTAGWTNFDPQNTDYDK